MTPYQKRNKTATTGWFLPLLFLMTMCGTGEKRGESEEGLISDISPTGIREIQQIYYTIPSPTEMLGTLEGHLMTYRHELPNPVTRLGQYTGSRQASLNLGIYLTDLAYVTMFERHETAVEYLEAVRDLATQLRLDKAISGSLIERARQNIGDLDSLSAISNEAFVRMVALSEESGRSATLVMISCGALVESLFLATHHAPSFEDAEHIYRHLADQKYVLQNLWKFAHSLSGDPAVADIIKKLEPLEEVYSKLDGEQAGTGVRKSESGKLVIGGEAPVLTEEEFRQLKEAAMEIRNQIVSQ